MKKSSHKRKRRKPKTVYPPGSNKQLSCLTTPNRLIVNKFDSSATTPEVIISSLTCQSGMNTQQKKLRSLKKTIKNKNLLLEEYIKLIETLKIENSLLIQKVQSQNSELQSVVKEKNGLSEDNTLLIMSVTKLLKIYKKFSNYINDDKIKRCVSPPDHPSTT